MAEEDDTQSIDQLLLPPRLPGIAGLGGAALEHYLSKPKGEPFNPGIMGAAPGLRREDFTDQPGSAQPQDKMIEGAADMGYHAWTGAFPFAAKGAAGVFGGRLAATADKVALAKAEDMAAKGVSREEIWEKTGWFQGADKKWRFEIPDDRAAVMTANAPTLEGKLAHKELFEAYPDIRQTRMFYNEPPGYGSYLPPEQGWFKKRPGAISVSDSSAPAPKTLRDTLLHETQHALQREENFAVGGNSDLMKAVMPYIKTPIPAGKESEIAFEAYRRLAGEVEARNVESRADFRLSQRHNQPPWTTEDRSRDVQTVRDSVSNILKKLKKLNPNAEVIPVEHNPFASRMTPVEHDPFAPPGGR